MLLLGTSINCTSSYNICDFFDWRNIENDYMKVPIRPLKVNRFENIPKSCRDKEA